MGNGYAGRGRLGTSLAVLFCCALLSEAAAQNAAPDVCSADEITFDIDGTSRRFTVEVVDTLASRARGLMHRTDLAADEGMLFVYEKASQTSFWMKNTPLPLDIIFMNKRGVICSIAANTTPFSLDHIPSGCASQTVLEVNAGVAAAQGLRVGMAARHPAITDPVWACE